MTNTALIGTEMAGGASKNKPPELSGGLSSYRFFFSYQGLILSDKIFLILCRLSCSFQYSLLLIRRAEYTLRNEDFEFYIVFSFWGGEKTTYVNCTQEIREDNPPGVYSLRTPLLYWAFKYKSILGTLKSVLITSFFSFLRMKLIITLSPNSALITSHVCLRSEVLLNKFFFYYVSAFNLLACLGKFPSSHRVDINVIDLYTSVIRKRFLNERSHRIKITRKCRRVRTIFRF